MSDPGVSGQTTSPWDRLLNSDIEMPRDMDPNDREVDRGNLTLLRLVVKKVIAGELSPDTLEKYVPLRDRFLQYAK